jgi:hypothetical protein
MAILLEKPQTSHFNIPTLYVSVNVRVTVSMEESFLENWIVKQILTAWLISKSHLIASDISIITPLENIRIMSHTTAWSSEECHITRGLKTDIYNQSAGSQGRRSCTKVTLVTAFLALYILLADNPRASSSPAVRRTFKQPMYWHWSHCVWIWH